MLNQLLDLGIETEKIDFLFDFSICKSNKIKTVINALSRTVIFDLENIKYRCKYRSDFIILSDTYNGNYNFNFAKETIVIDIGMNIGITPLFFAQKPNVTKVYGFEPFSETFQQAIENFKLNELSITQKIIPCNIGLGKEDCIKKLVYFPEYSGGMKVIGSSYNEDNNPNLSKVKIMKAGHIIEQIIKDNIEKCICVKCDCEGSEYEIFESIEESQILNKIDVILMEWHPGNILELEKRLIRNHFFYIKSYTTTTFGFIYAFNLKK